MMSNANVEYLFQITAPSPDRALGGASHAGDNQPAFDEHLAQAAETSREATSKNDVKPVPVEYSRPQDHRRLSAESQQTPATSDKVPSPECATCGEPEALAADRGSEPATLDEAGVTGEASDAGTVVDEAEDEDEDATENANENETNAVDGVSPDAIPDAAAVLETAVAPSETASTDAKLEASAEQAPIAATSTTDEQGGGDRQPSSMATTALSDKPETLDPRTTTVDSTLQSTQETKQAEQIANAAAAIATTAQLTEAVRAADAKNAGEDRDTKTSSQSSSTTGKFDVPPSFVHDPRKIGPATRKVDKPNRRTADKSKTDESRRTAGQRTEAAAANRTVVAAAVNHTPASLTVSSTVPESTNELAPTSAKPTASKTDVLLQPLGRSHRAGAAGRGARGAAAEHMPRIDSARFVGRVAKAVQTAHERGGALQLRLSPPELGALRLELNVQNGVMTAALETETAAARQVLLDHLPALRDRLAEQNIRIERFDVDVRQEDSGNQGDPRAQQHDQRQRQSHAPAPRQPLNQPQSAEPDPRNVAPLRSRQTNSGINILA